MTTRRTIYLSRPLAERVEAYLRAHPEATLSGLVQEALEQHLTPPDPGAILELAGVVEQASTTARERAEDRVVQHRRA